MMRSKCRQELRDVALFKSLPDAVIEQLAAAATLHHLKLDESLFASGDQAESIYIVRQGGVRLVEHTSAGKAVNIKVYGRDDLFGLLALSGQHIRSATIEAVEDTVIISIRADTLRQTMIAYPELGLLLIDWLIQHVHHAHDRIRHLAAERTEQRLARALLHFYRKFGAQHDDCEVITASLSQQDIAEFTGTTVETVNRYLRKWESAGWLRLSRRRIELLSQDQLAAVAASEYLSGYFPE